MCLPCSKPFGWRAAYSAGNWRHLPTGCSAYGPTKMRVGFIKVNHNGWWICKLPKCCCDRWRLDFPICHRGVRPSPPSRSTRSSTSWTRFQLPTCNACTLKPTRSLSTVQTESRALGIDPRHLPIPLVASEWQLAVITGTITSITCKLPQTSRSAPPRRSSRRWWRWRIPAELSTQFMAAQKKEEKNVSNRQSVRNLIDPHPRYAARIINPSTVPLACTIWFMAKLNDNGHPSSSESLQISRPSSPSRANKKKQKWMAIQRQ